MSGKEKLPTHKQITLNNRRLMSNRTTPSFMSGPPVQRAAEGIENKVIDTAKDGELYGWNQMLEGSLLNTRGPRGPTPSSVSDHPSGLDNFALFLNFTLESPALLSSSLTPPPPPNPLHSRRDPSARSGGFDESGWKRDPIS